MAKLSVIVAIIIYILKELEIIANTKDKLEELLSVDQEFKFEVQYEGVLLNELVKSRIPQIDQQIQRFSQR